jgi:hypothetical protein
MFEVIGQFFNEPVRMGDVVVLYILYMILPTERITRLGEDLYYRLKGAIRGQEGG